MKLNDIYNRNELIAFLKDDFLPGFNVDIRNVDQRSSTKTIEKAIFLGECPDLDLQVFDLETSGKSEKKISQALDSFKLLKEYQSYRSLVAYHSKDDRNWRFALLQMTPDVTEKGKIATKFSNPRRYSFLLGPQAKIKTPEKYLIKDGQVKDFEDLQRRFSVEVVNKDFYREIARFFIRLVGGDTKLGSKTEHFKPELNLPSVDPNDHKTYQEYTVRLIGRIIFCWFLKQKKSQEGISLLPEEFLSSEAVKNSADYYHTILEPVFFEILNRPRESRKPQFRNGYDKIPYLNGGLFDPHYDDFYEGQPSFALKIPNDWFRELFEVLETYNFTIDENTSLDVDLSIDPEMLGRIFENLLAEINPETGESARKSTGSYYTPRQIVEYMVDQSLLQYLLTKTEIDKQKLQALISVDTADDEQFPLSDEEKRKVVNALDEVKIIDPACGSGAFPIGILQKIVWILGKVDTNGKLWFDKKLEGLDPILHEDFKQKFQNENFDYIRKTGVIRDSIYGVDIQPIAVEVSKLRSFLTLIVDEDIDEEKENRGIKPLPNLEFKFVAANSLINLPNTAGSNNGQVGMFEEKSEIEQLKKLRDVYFVSNGFEKEKIKSRFKDVQREMFKKQIGKGGLGQLTMALAAWDPFKDESSSWFDPEWMFGLNRFDIVIANPPYGIKFSKLNNPDIFELYKKIVRGEVESYILFYYIGLNLLKPGGCLSYISPDSWFTNRGAAALRKHISTNSTVLDVFDCYKPFEGAKDTRVHTVLILNSATDATARVQQVLPSNTSKVYRKYEVPQAVIRSFCDNEWRFYISKDERSIFNKMESLSDKLFNLYNIKYGLRTGDNNKYLGSDKNDYPVIAGSDIASLYCVKWKEKYLRKMDGLTKSYFNEFFSDKKLIIQYVRTNSLNINARWIEAAYIEGPFIPLNSLNYIYKKNEGYSIKYLLGILNSFLMNRYYRSYYTDVNVKPTYLMQLPIPKSNLQDRNVITNLVDKILSITSSDDYTQDDQKQSYVKELETQIDNLVYKLYDLTPDEIKIIEDSMVKKAGVK